jgi:predicted RNA-binding Zn-ribbon protein involved in translation (DUF1610 family)
MKTDPPAAPLDEFAPLDDLDGWNTDEKCPHCGKAIDDLYELIDSGGEENVFDCPHCEQSVIGSEWR